jgi:iron complex outermembrane receptor protein
MTETPLARSIRRLFAGGGAIGLALLAAPAPAQEAAPKPIARVEVTGSNIRRSEAETSSSVITLNRTDLERSGKNTVAELMQDLAIDNSGSVPTSFGNGFAAGASGISLRGLGAASTLVLLNGRRMAPYGLADDGQKQFSDLNIIPTDAVDRIEVLKDGASAIYGSDAIAGVVNIILRKDYVGNTFRFNHGISQDKDGQQTNIAFTKGIGNLDDDRYNVLFSIEYKKFKPIWYGDRSDRDWIGRIDLRPWGFSAAEALGGTGAIVPGSGGAGSAVNGNVRPVGSTGDFFNRGSLDPAAGFTRQFPGAACGNFTNHPQGDPGGGCLIDAPQQYSQAIPKQENLTFYLRGTLKVPYDIETYSELLYYTSDTDSSTTPSTVSGSVGYPGGPVNNSIVRLGANHPDNPYFGTPATLRYLAADVGPRVSAIGSTFVRWIGGARGAHFGWDWDSALLFSHNHVNNIQNGYLQRDVAFALLDPTAANVTAAQANPAYAGLPPGTVWRIAENAGLNSPALYAALSPTIGNAANTKLAQWDAKATREFDGIPYLAGPLGLAVGTEFRHEATELVPTAGTERGNIIGLGYSAYSGGHNVFALYGEGLAPLPFNLEASAAIRYDHFTDVGNSYTPKAGLKWTPVREFALRGTFARGFRAPSPAENGVGGLAAYSTAADPVRCALGVPGTCSPASIALITSPNPALSPERSRSYTAGIIWDPLPRASISVDYWKIQRKNEINQQQIDQAIAAGNVARDPSNVSGIAGDPGPITAVLTRYVNSAQTKVRGLDVDARYSHRLPDNWGTASVDIKYTRIFEWLRTEQDGSTFEFAGTHGNCDVTNCTGTPDNRANLRFGWDRNDWRVSLNVNYRGVLDNVLFRGDSCASTYANGNPAPGDCELASFTTFDLVGRWKPASRWEISASVQNLFNKVAPLDPLTYGAQAFNPLDYEGARGRFFTLGARYTF